MHLHQLVHYPGYQSPLALLFLVLSLLLLLLLLLLLFPKAVFLLLHNTDFCRLVSLQSTLFLLFDKAARLLAYLIFGRRDFRVKSSFNFILFSLYAKILSADKLYTKYVNKYLNYITVLHGIYNQSIYGNQQSKIMHLNSRCSTRVSCFHLVSNFQYPPSGFSEIEYVQGNHEIE